jgi:hypothetical protein
MASIFARSTIIPSFGMIYQGNEFLLGKMKIWIIFHRAYAPSNIVELVSNVLHVPLEFKNISIYHQGKPK